MAKGTYIEEQEVMSKAFTSLTPTAMRVYLLLKMRIKKTAIGNGKKVKWTAINNGELEFSYSEAENKHGIPRSSFMNAITRLVETGFIDIEHSGSGGVKGDKSRYAISTRWVKFGTPHFIFKTSPKDSRGGRGFGAFPEHRNDRSKNRP
jgi:hypothetical protein